MILRSYIFCCFCLGRKDGGSLCGIATREWSEWDSRQPDVVGIIYKAFFSPCLPFMMHVLRYGVGL